MRNALRALGHEAAYALRRLTGDEKAALMAAAALGRSKRLIFCITNGRSGTATLAKHLMCIDGVSGGHEKKPKMQRVMRWAQLCPDLARDFLLYTKLPAIATKPGDVYAETNHLFGKGFFEPLAEIGIMPSLILLRRDRRETARSLHDLGTIPGRSSTGLKWYLSPRDNVFVDLPEWRRLTDYQLCYWHTLEIEARQARYGAEARARGAPCADLDIEELNRPHGFERLIERLALPIGENDRQRVRHLAGHRSNARTHEKTALRQLCGLPDPGDLGAQEREVERLIRHQPRRKATHGIIARYLQPAAW